MATKEEKEMERRKKGKFPVAFKEHPPEQLFKITTENGTVTVANDVAVEYAYNQYLEGAKKIKFVLPDGTKQKRRFLHKFNRGIDFQKDQHERMKEKMEKLGLPKFDLQDESVPETFEDGRLIPEMRRAMTRRVKEDE